MIASLSGVVEAVTTSSAVVTVNGVGMEVLATPSTLAHLHVGEHARVLTALVVREDSLTLFGFETADERDVFHILLGVSGIGPRTALAILSVLPPNELRNAIAAKNETALMRVPGIGKKGAQRMILEIGTKLGPALSPLSDAEVSVPVPADPDVVEALINLGWSEKLATEAIEEARVTAGESSLTVPELLRNALQILGSKR